MREGRTASLLALGAWSLFYVVLGVNYAASSGFDAEWGDLLFAYLGTPIAAALAVMLVQQLRGHRHMTPA